MNSMVSAGDPMGGAYGMGVGQPTSSNMMMSSSYGNGGAPTIPPNMGGGASGMVQSMYQGGGVRQIQKMSSAHHLSTVQMKLLSAQIKAYRCLARNMPLPDQLKAFIMSHAANVSGRTTPTQVGGDVGTTAPPAAIQSPPQPQGGKPAHAGGVATAVSTVSTSEGTGQSTNQSEDKSEGSKSSSGGESKPGQTQLRSVKLTSINKPPGIDPETIIKERETR